MSARKAPGTSLKRYEKPSRRAAVSREARCPVPSFRLFPFDLYGTSTNARKGHGWLKVKGSLNTLTITLKRRTFLVRMIRTPILVPADRYCYASRLPNFSGTRVFFSPPTSSIMRTLFSVALAVLIAVPAIAQTSRDTGFDLLRLEPSARASALSGTIGSVASDDPSSVMYNPALLTEDMHRGLSLTYLNHLSDVNAGFISYARTVGNLGTFAAGVRYLSYGSFERADENGVRDGTTFGAGEAALSLSYSQQLTPKLRGGATVHAAFASIDDAGGQALAADLGVLYTIPGQQIGISASIHNVGFALSSLGETSDRLPVDLRLGISKRLERLPLTIMLMGYNLHSYSGDDSALDEALRHVNVAGEIRIGAPVAIRVGYNPRRHQELSTGGRLDLAGLSAGFGINLSRFNFDYAFNSWSELGGLHQLSVRTQL